MLVEMMIWIPKYLRDKFRKCLINFLFLINFDIYSFAINKINYIIIILKMQAPKYVEKNIDIIRYREK